jgi:hypothetical protein
MHSGNSVLKKQLFGFINAYYACGQYITLIVCGRIVFPA